LYTIAKDTEFQQKVKEKIGRSFNFGPGRRLLGGGQALARGAVAVVDREYANILKKQV
jgi:hypothetical protein